MSIANHLNPLSMSHHLKSWKRIYSHCLTGMVNLNQEKLHNTMNLIEQNKGTTGIYWGSDLLYPELQNKREPISN